MCQAGNWGQDANAEMLDLQQKMKRCSTATKMSYKTASWHFNLQATNQWKGHRHRLTHVMYLPWPTENDTRHPFLGLITWCPLKFLQLIWNPKVSNLQDTSCFRGGAWTEMRSVKKRVSRYEDAQFITRVDLWHCDQYNQGDSYRKILFCCVGWGW